MLDCPRFSRVSPDLDNYNPVFACYPLLGITDHQVDKFQDFITLLHCGYEDGLSEILDVLIFKANDFIDSPEELLLFFTYFTYVFSHGSDDHYFTCYVINTLSKLMLKLPGTSFFLYH